MYYFTVQETSKMLKVSDKTVRNWIKQWGLPAKKVGGQFRIKEQDLRKFVEEIA